MIILLLILAAGPACKPTPPIPINCPPGQVLECKIPKRPKPDQPCAKCECRPPRPARPRPAA